MDRSGVIVAAQTFFTLDFKRNVGGVTQSIHVTDEGPLVETANASTGQVIDSQKMIDLPNLGRNPFIFANLAPNMVQVGDSRFTRMHGQIGSSAISIAGGPIRGNSYLFDGVPITDSVNRAVIIPTMDAVMEAGRTGGGMFNTFLKGGSNQIYGSLVGCNREKQFLASNFFNNRNGIVWPDKAFLVCFTGSLSPEGRPLA